MICLSDDVDDVRGGLAILSHDMEGVRALPVADLILDDTLAYIRKNEFSADTHSKHLSMTPSIEDAVTVYRGATKSNSESSCLFIE